MAAIGTRLGVLCHDGESFVSQIFDQLGVGVGIEAKTAQLHPHDRWDGRHLDFVSGLLRAQRGHYPVEDVPTDDGVAGGVFDLGERQMF